MIKRMIKGLPTNNRMADKPLSAAVGLPRWPRSLLRMFGRHRHRSRRCSNTVEDAGAT